MSHSTLPGRRLLGVAFASAAGLAFSQSALGSFPGLGVTSTIATGDSPAGAGGEQVIRVTDVAVDNTGRWYVNVELTGPDNQDLAIFSPDGLYQREGTATNFVGPPNARLDIMDEFDVNASGTIAQQVDFVTPTDMGEGVYVDGQLVIRDGVAYTAPGGPAGFAFSGLGGVDINDNGQLLVRGTVTDGSVDRGVFALLNPDGSGGYTQQQLFLAGEVVAGVPVGALGVAQTDYALNNAGDVIVTMSVSGASGTTDGAIVRYNAAAGTYDLLAREGNASPVPGRNYVSLLFREVDINDAGDYVFRSQLSGDSSSNQVIVKNGAIFKQEGQTVDTTIGTFTITDLGSTPVLLTPAGDVVYYANFNAPAGQTQGIFLNDTLLLHRGVSTFDGISLGGVLLDDVVLDLIPNFDNAFYLSPDGRYLIVEAGLRHPDVTGVFESALVIDLATVPEPTTALAALAAWPLLRRRRA